MANGQEPIEIIKAPFVAKITEINGNEIAQHGDCVHIGRGQVGIITSGTLSPVLDKNIALCRIDSKYSELNTEVEVDNVGSYAEDIVSIVGLQIDAIPSGDSFIKVSVVPDNQSFVTPLRQDVLNHDIGKSLVEVVEVDTNVLN